MVWNLVDAFPTEREKELDTELVDVLERLLKKVREIEQREQLRSEKQQQNNNHEAEEKKAVLPERDSKVQLTREELEKAREWYNRQFLLDVAKKDIWDRSVDP